MGGHSSLPLEYLLWFTVAASLKNLFLERIHTFRHPLGRMHFTLVLPWCLCNMRKYAPPWPLT
jgi:hypothetical protein